jgi:predicted dehydrogenase
MGEIGVAIIGTGFMGRAHALAYSAVSGVFDTALRPVPKTIVDIDEPAARRFQDQFGFAHSCANWREAVADPAIGIVSITTPTALHEEIAIGAAKAGKHIHCEKPLANDAAAALRMLEAARAAGVVTQVGYNYLKNPLLRLAREMIAGGELGEIYSLRALHAEDFMADPDQPHSWRLDPAGSGALADIGSHAIAVARHLLGPIVEVSADLQTMIASRPAQRGSVERRPVLVDDVARLNVRFACGAGGSIEANWLATGRTMQLAFEVAGSKGALAFTQERMNELHFYKIEEGRREAGFRRIEAGPAHEPYGRFCVAPGHHLGFNDLKTIEVAEFIDAIAGGPAIATGFAEALAVQRVIDAAITSSRARAWSRVA